MLALLEFLATPLGRRLAVGAGLLTLVGVADAYIAVHEYNKGWHAAIAAVAKKDQEALNAVNKAVSDVDECDRRGGTWDVTSGVCN